MMPLNRKHVLRANQTRGHSDLVDGQSVLVLQGDAS
jgi:hypothetical protein